MISGYIEKIKYRNEENGYTVLSVSVEGEEEILVGTFSHIEEGSYISASVKERVHPVYGEQLFVESYELKRPDDEKGIEKYLASGAIKGIGPVLAARIVKKFAKPSNWNTSYTFGWRLKRTISPPFPFTAFKNAVNEPIPVEET